MTAVQAYQRLTALCARGEHCQYDLTEKMRQWGMAPEEQAQVMERLVRERYVDDERYARAYVQDKVDYAHWGRRKIEQGLWQKHIDDTVARQALDDVDAQRWADVLRPLLKQKRRSTRAASEYELTMKLIKFAMGRGFTMDVIRQCLEVEDEDELAQ